MTGDSSADIHRNKASCIIQILLWIVPLREKLKREESGERKREGNGKGEVKGRKGRVKERAEGKGEEEKERGGKGREM